MSSHKSWAQSYWHAWAGISTFKSFFGTPNADEIFTTSAWHAFKFKTYDCQSHLSQGPFESECFLPSLRISKHQVQGHELCLKAAAPGKVQGNTTSYLQIFAASEIWTCIYCIYVHVISLFIFLCVSKYVKILKKHTERYFFRKSCFASWNLLDRTCIQHASSARNTTVSAYLLIARNLNAQTTVGCD